jgi:hypothetical protein
MAIAGMAHLAAHGQFGNWLTRLVRGGVLLSPAEQWLLHQLAGNLPPHLKPVADQQLASYNLAQREPDERAVNLYRRPSMRPDTPLFEMPPRKDFPLTRITVSVAGSADPVHAVLTAVEGRVFCMSFNRSVKRLPVAGMKLVEVRSAWRSNFPVRPGGSTSRVQNRPSPGE